MNGLFEHLPRRAEADQLDVVPVLRTGLDQRGETVVFAFQGKTVTRSDLRSRVGGVQKWLAESGLRKGDRVAVMLSNSAEHISLIYALMLSGVVWVPVNTKLRGAGLEYMLSHSSPRMLITEEAFPDAIEQADRLGLKTVHLSELSTLSSSAGLTDVAIAPTDPLCIIYTSGTTGAPKGVLFTHRMMRIASEAVLRVANVQSQSRLFVWEPLCHIGGAQMLVVPFLEDAQLHVVERFSASSFWAEWETAKATHLHYLGGVLNILMLTPRPGNAAIHTAWGAGISGAHWNAIRDTFNCELRECYGMTECSSFTTLNETGVPGSIGRPLPWLTVELLDDEGKPVPVGEIGEIVVSSQLEGVFFPGYLDNPEATASALRGERLHTGDNARQDADGNLYFVGRSSDSMRVRGENVSAWEVEHVFHEHPSIHSSAAVGVASDIGEQEILLYVKIKEGETANWEDIIEWARPKLAAYQLPRYFQEIDQFELTPSERIRKHLLPRDVSLAWKRAN